MSESNPNTCGVVVGALMILFGALALLAQVFRDALDWSMIWPFAVVAAGAAFFVVMFAGGRASSAFAIPGSILGTVGRRLRPPPAPARRGEPKDEVIPAQEDAT